MGIAEVEVQIKRIGRHTFQTELDNALEHRLREIALTGIKATLEQALQEELTAELGFEPYARLPTGRKPASQQRSGCFTRQTDTSYVWPQIRRRAQQLGAHLVFLDESGFLLIPNVKRTWVPVGQTPTIRYCFKHTKISAISALVVSAQRKPIALYLRFRRRRRKGPDVKRFLKLTPAGARTNHFALGQRAHPSPSRSESLVRITSAFAGRGVLWICARTQSSGVCLVSVRFRCSE